MILRTRHRLKSAATGLAVATMVASCGSPSSSKHSTASSSAADARGSDKDGVTPPKEYYQALFAETVAKLTDDSSGPAPVVAPAAANSSKDTTAAPVPTATDVPPASPPPVATALPATPALPTAIPTTAAVPAPTPVSSAPQAATQPVLWVNFGGATVSKGFSRGQSFLVCSDKAVLPAATDRSAEDQAKIVSKVQKYFTDAGVHLLVTSTKPTAGDWTTVHVAGTMADLGCPEEEVLGTAPQDNGNANPNDVAFVFSKRAASTDLLAQAIAHEAGHTYGLSHVTDPTDLMALDASDKVTGFKVSALCDGSGNQDGPALLRKALNGQSTGGAGDSHGHDGTGKPGDHSPPGMDKLHSIASILHGLTPDEIKNIATLFHGRQADSIGRTGFPCLLKLIMFWHRLTHGQVGEGVHGRGDINVSVAVNINILNIFKGNTAPQPGEESPARPSVSGSNPEEALPPLPAPAPAASGTATDLASMLDLPAHTPDMATLIQNLKQTASAMNQQYQGADAKAMVSVVVVAYAQQVPATLGKKN